MFVSISLIDNESPLVKLMVSRIAIIWTDDGLIYWHVYA